MVEIKTQGKDDDEPEVLPIKPYARLLTMLGEQLIKNERIALIELIKNCYDADASWVKVSFLNFGEGWKINKDSKIVIEDDGVGMGKHIIVNHLTNPATPEKKIRKEKKPITEKGRHLQGEKGIGRFAILKLGRKILITTKRKSDRLEHIVDYDFQDYDDEFLKVNGKKKTVFLDDLGVKYWTRKPEVIVNSKINVGLRSIKRATQGTRIEISNLKGSWSEAKVEKVYQDVARLQSIFMPANLVKDEPGLDSKNESKDAFDIYIYENSERLEYKDHGERLAQLIRLNSVLRYESGRFDQSANQFIYTKNGEEVTLSLSDAEVKGNKKAKNHFKVQDKPVVYRKPSCGDFEFGIFVFDLSAKADDKIALSREEKDVIRQHRIYLYRDGVRVYPYGEPDDDWLEIDQHRGTKSAGDFLSNDQVVGYVNISHKFNPELVDKTNREGLIDNGIVIEDFQALLQVLLAHIRHKDYKQYQIDKQKKKTNPVQINSEKLVQKGINSLKEMATDVTVFTSSKALKSLSELEKNYTAEKSYLTNRAETTEELAGVGLSVETTSHDVISMIQKTENRLDKLLKDCMYGPIDQSVFAEELQILRGQVSFISSQMGSMQSLFSSTKQRRKNIRVITLVEKVQQIYRGILNEKDISLEIETRGSPLVAKTTDAVLLQVLINLFDNAVYWFDVLDGDFQKIIKISLDGSDGSMVFSDNGPGIVRSDIPYIFEPFYSGKGEEGRGLGLYIARQLLRRHDYEIELASLKAHELQRGANFLINFVTE